MNAARDGATGGEEGPTPARARAGAAALAALLALPAPALATGGDLSARLDARWDFDAPAASEARFRAEIAAVAPRSREAAEAMTQLARALGLQRNFAAADAVLDDVRALQHALPVRVRVRYLLERGRLRNASGAPAQAVPLFEDALAASNQDTLPGADFYRVDALHMLGIAAPAQQRLDWNLRALAAAEASADPRTRGWRASLLNNVGWTCHERGDDVAALDAWEKALAAREASGTAAQIRIAKWTMGRGLRALGRLDEAQAIQQALAADGAADDGYVYEELAEIALARHDAGAAQPLAAKAYALLKADADLQAREPERLARLAKIGSVAAQ